MHGGPRPQRDHLPSASKNPSRARGDRDYDGDDCRGWWPKEQTHRSTTDPKARLYRNARGQQARPASLGHVLVEDRQGLIVDTRVTTADGTAEADAAPLAAYGLKQRKPRAATLAADRAYDRRDLAETFRELGVVVHAAQRSRASAPDRRTKRLMYCRLPTGPRVSQYEEMLEHPIPGDAVAG